MNITKYTNKNIIEKLTDVDEILESWDKFLTNFDWRPDKKEFPIYHRGQIIDEDKSIKWNREEVERYRAAREAEEKRLWVLRNELDSLYEKTLMKALADEYEISTKEASIIWTQAYADNHSFGISSVYNKFGELAYMYHELCKVTKQSNNQNNSIIIDFTSGKYIQSANDGVQGKEYK